MGEEGWKQNLKEGREGKRIPILKAAVTNSYTVHKSKFLCIGVDALQKNTRATAMQKYCNFDDVCEQSRF
jgi:hypothetical protein